MNRSLAETCCVSPPCLMRDCSVCPMAFRSEGDGLAFVVHHLLELIVADLDEQIARGDLLRLAAVLDAGLQRLPDGLQIGRRWARLRSPSSPRAHRGRS